MRKISRLRRSFVLSTVTMLMLSCSSDNNDPASDNMTLTFEATVNGEPFSCGEQYQIGTSLMPTQVNDFRLFVSEVQFLGSDEVTYPFALTQDGIWQLDNIALLDFEDGCENGTPSMNTAISGRLNAQEIEGVCFDIAVPVARNHTDNVLQPSPLNTSGMFWNWQGGYKFLRVDMKGDPGAGEQFANQGFQLHIGSTGCASQNAQTAPEQACAYPNRATICLDNFNPETDTIGLDLGTLLAEANTSSNTPDTAPGCMSNNDDPECQAVFPGLGLNFHYIASGQTDAVVFEGVNQTFASVRPREIVQ